MDKGSPELLTTEAMSAPIPEKDKTPLMLLEDRVRRLEDLHLVAKVQEEQAHLVAEFERCKADPHYFISNYCKVKFTTSDPQGPYRLDTNPPASDYHKYKYGDMPKGCKYQIHFDPKASPKNIPFSVALEYMRAGREVRRPHWATPSRRRVQPHGIGGVGGLYVITGASYNEGPFSPDTAEMVATDWEVIPEP